MTHPRRLFGWRFWVGRGIVALVLGVVTTVAVAWSTNLWGRDTMQLHPSAIVVRTSVEGLGYYLQGQAGPGRASRFGWSTSADARPYGLSVGAGEYLPETKDPVELPHGREYWARLDPRRGPVRPPPILEVPANHALSGDAAWADYMAYMFHESARGWPMLALKSTSYWSPSRGTVVDSWAWRPPNPFLYSVHGFLLRPVPLGFAVDTGLYAFVWLAAFAGIRESRRRWRIAHRRCPRCAYDLSGGTPLCPECGHGAAPPPIA